MCWTAHDSAFPVVVGCAWEAITGMHGSPDGQTTRGGPPCTREACRHPVRFRCTCRPCLCHRVLDLRDALTDARAGGGQGGGACLDMGTLLRQRQRGGACSPVRAVATWTTRSARRSTASSAASTTSSQRVCRAMTLGLLPYPCACVAWCMRSMRSASRALFGRERAEDVVE